jgi:hypothetical protein
MPLPVHSQTNGPGPTRRGARRGPAAPAEPALQQRAVAALFVALLSLAGLVGLNNWNHGIYIVLFALLAGVVSLWLAGTSLSRAGKARAARPHGAIAAVAIGSVGVLMSALLLAAFALLGNQLAQYGRCMNAANTISTQQSCTTQFNNMLAREISALRTGTQR